MRIVKYLFFLLLLSLFALSVFIATLRTEYVVEKSKIIYSTKSTVYNYVDELKNWKDWSAITAEDAQLNLTYSKKTIGLGAICTWESSNGNGKLKTVSVKRNEQIIQTLTLNDASANVIMTLKDTLGKTKVTLTARGTMSFKSKVFAFFNFGDDNKLATTFEKSLINLNKKLDYELNFWDVQVSGLVKKLDAFYLSETFSCPISKVSKNSAIVFSKITIFCRNNNITRTGKPFIIYHRIDKINKHTKISICIPIKEAIFTTDGSEILCDTLKSFNAVKTIFRGNYKHTQKAIDKTFDYIKINKLSADPTFSHLEIYTIGKNEINAPSKWVTEMYFPTSTIPIVKSRISKALPEQEILLENVELEKTKVE